MASFTAAGFYWLLLADEDRLHLAHGAAIISVLAPLEMSQREAGDIFACGARIEGALRPTDVLGRTKVRELFHLRRKLLQHPAPLHLPEFRQAPLRGRLGESAQPLVILLPQSRVDLAPPTAKQIEDFHVFRFSRRRHGGVETHAAMTGKTRRFPYDSTVCLMKQNLPARTSRLQTQDH